RASRLSARRAAMATLAPRVANRKAVASPIPLDAPVTTATRPVNGLAVMTADMWSLPSCVCCVHSRQQLQVVLMRGQAGPAYRGTRWATIGANGAAAARQTVGYERAEAN